MYKFTIILLLFLFVISVKAKGAHKLLIFKNINGSEFEVNSNRMEAIRGTDFSLICRFMNSSKEEALDIHLIWSRKRGKIKFSNTDDQNDLMENNIVDANILNFTSVTVNDEGKYFCRSIKTGQFRKVELIVKYKIYLKDSDHHLIYKRETEFSKALDETDKAVKLWKEEQDKQYNSDNNNFNYNYNNRYDSNSDSHYNSNNDYSKSENITDTPLKIFYMLIAAIGLFVVIYAITKCCHDNAENQQNDGSPQRPGRYRQYRSNRGNHYRQNTSNTRIHTLGTTSGQCTHRACMDNRLLDPSHNCLLDYVEDDYRYNTARTGMVHGNSLDLPPTYQDSTANSATSSTNNLNVADDGFSTRILNADNNDNSPLPPTYEDALHNIVLSEPAISDTHHASNDSGGGGDTGATADSGGGGGDSGGGGGDSGGGGGDSGGGGGDSGGGGGDSGGGGGGSDD